MNKILIIGCGHMGSALLSSWYQKTNNIFSVVDPKNYKKLKKKYKKRFTAYKSLEEINNLKEFDIILFAVKPQIAEKVLFKFSKFKYKKNVLFLSIIAGKKISFFNKYLQNNIQFIRVMPNMPTLISMGMSCLVSNNFTTSRNKNFATRLFKKVGEVLWFKEEKKLDQVTAISGSGPAYYSLFIDNLQKAAIKIGFNKKDANKLVMQTALGSVNLLLNSNKNAEQMTKSIAIKGGTTESAIKTFNKNNQLKNIIEKSVKAAYRRSIQLGKK